MSLILTRKVGEAIIIMGPGDVPLRRMYVVAIEGNTVRLAFDAPPDVRFIREELLPEEARQRWAEDTGNKAMLVTSWLLPFLLPT